MWFQVQTELDILPFMCGVGLERNDCLFSTSTPYVYVAILNLNASIPGPSFLTSPFFVCLFVLRFTVPVNKISFMLGWSQLFLDINLES